MLDRKLHPLESLVFRALPPLRSNNACMFAMVLPGFIGIQLAGGLGHALGTSNSASLALGLGGTALLALGGYGLLRHQGYVASR